MPAELSTTMISCVRHRESCILGCMTGFQQSTKPQATELRQLTLLLSHAIAEMRSWEAAELALLGSVAKQV